MTFIDKLKSVRCQRHVIADNLLDSTNLCASGARHEINQMWNSYQQLAERDFPLRFAKDPEAKYWEMYVACALRKIGFQVHREQDGPDFWVESSEGRIWIEATVPGPGDSGNPDCVPEPPVNQVSDTPVRQIVLRLTSAIHDKQMKFRHYQRRGIVGQNDRCVIALSAAKLLYPVTTDYIQRAVYEAGDLYVAIDSTSLKAVERGRRHEPQISKRSSPPFNKPTFLDGSCSHVSALLFGWRGIANTLPILGSEWVLFHNHKAQNPLTRGWLRKGSEHWVEVDDAFIHLRSQQWSH